MLLLSKEHLDKHQGPHMKVLLEILSDNETRIKIKPTINIVGVEYRSDINILISLN